MKNLFGREFRRLRTKERITLREISKILGCTIGLLSNVEQGRVAPLSNEQIRLFSEYFAIPKGDLIEAANVDRLHWENSTASCSSGDGCDLVDQIEELLEKLNKNERNIIIPFLKRFIFESEIMQ